MEQQILQCVREGLGWDNATIKRIEQIKGGYLANAYIVTVDNDGALTQIFVKEQNEQKWGTERASDSVASYFSSTIAGREQPLSPKVLGSYSLLDGSLVPIEQAVNGKIYQIQECVPGKNLLGLCTPVVSAELVGREAELGHKIAAIFAEIHSIKYPIKKGTKFDEYSRSLRDVIAHPELTLNILHNFLQDSPVLSGDFRYAYITEMVKVAEHFSQFPERNALVHGDAWHANILVNGGNLYAIDFSRLVHGEPGIDVGHFYMVCVVLGLYYKDDFHIRLGNAFIDEYVSITHDEFIFETMSTGVGFTGAVSVVKDFFPDINDDARKTLIAFVYSCLKNKKVSKVQSWKEL